MQRNFTADIEINLSKRNQKIVKIIPYYDRDKGIAKTIETILCREMAYITEEEFGEFDTLSAKTKA